jgi:RNA polymerase sigma-70 factor (ECF subfamily)
VNVDKHKNITDAELLQHFYADHDNKWLGILLQRYTLLLLGVCMKYLKNEDDARDGVQQVFLKAITELHKYKVEYFKSWLYMIARNHCLMKLRKHPLKNTAELEKHEIGFYDDLILNNKQFADKEKIYSLLQQSLQQLNSEQHTCILLFYLEKKTYQQIVTQTGYNMLQVKSCIQNGKRNLKIMIEKKMRDNNLEV